MPFALLTPMNDATPRVCLFDAMLGIAYDQSSVDHCLARHKFVLEGTGNVCQCRSVETMGSVTELLAKSRQMRSFDRAAQAT